MPRSGEELSDFVSILLKTSDEGDTKESLTKFIHQALVRRDVVVDLIEKAQKRGHRAYKNIDMQRVRAKAAETLPENGVPPEIAKLIPYDDLLDKIQIQKAATPVPGKTTLDIAAENLARMRLNGVVLEKSSYDEADINAQRIEAVRRFAEKLGKDCPRRTQKIPQSTHTERDDSSSTDEEDPAPELDTQCPSAKKMRLSDAARVVDETKAQKKVECLRVATGNVMIDQFEPWYFGVAFAFLFKYCTGMPDMPAFAKKPRYRRLDDAPRIETNLWVRVMARRVEAQINRDWHFGFVTWNYMFRSAVNLSRTWFAYDRPQQTDEGMHKFTAKDLETGALEICNALWSKYRDVDGKMKKVHGDMTKIRYVPGLSPAAIKLLQNIEHTSRRLPGTQETRRLMRFDTHANRVRYGVPIFVTFSPDEAHNLLMIRLSRTRKSDTVFTEGSDPVGQKYCERQQPPICTSVRRNGDMIVRVSVESLLHHVPSYDERRQLLARDALASVDGFRVLVSLTYEHLFGMRVCGFCPDCNNGEQGSPCSDLFGSNAFPEGGIFGRIDAGYTSIEAQKSTGSLHAHSQLFVQ